MRDDKTAQIEGMENIRLIGRGWKFEGYDKIPFIFWRNTLNQCVKAVKALGLGWGGVDLALAEPGGWYILEVNSAPAIKGKCLAAWLVAMQDLLGTEE